jgi:penicillin-binding protein 1A
MFRVLSAVFGGLAVLLTLAVLGAVVAVFSIARELPDHRALARYEPPITTRLYSGDGQLLAEYAAEKRLFLPIDAMPRLVTDAFLSAEDKTFYTHPGIDLPGVVNAIVTNVQNWRAGSDRRPIGASTITQQVAKNFLVGAEMSLDRKVKEAILAFRIEKAFSKDKILELYLNEIYLGNGAYGIASAALNYFDKSLDQLSIAEAALLAGLPKAPSNYDPLRQPAAAKARRDWVITRMVEDGRITAAEGEAAKATPIELHPRQIIAPVEADYFAEDVRRELARRYGENALYKGGLTVHSTLDPRLQAIADKVLREALLRYDRGHGWAGPVYQLTGAKKPGTLPADWREQLASLSPPGGYEMWQLAAVLQTVGGGARLGFADGTTGTLPAGEMRSTRGRRIAVGDVLAVTALKGGLYGLRQPPQVEGALVALDPHTGRVLAMSGGFSFKRSQFNRASQALRQPGSTFKPFVYLAALENGYTPSTIVNDTRFTASGGPGRARYAPRNYSHRFYGPTTLRSGLEQSHNVMVVRMADDIGMDRVSDVAQRFGVADEMSLVLPNALGAKETTLLRITAAYGMFVNGGQQVIPTLIDRIQDRYGKVIYRQDPRVCFGCATAAWSEEGLRPDVMDDRPPVTDPASAYQIVNMLQGVVERGTAKKALAGLGRPLGGKTGTSDEARDVWFIGFSPDLVVGVFLGYDEPRSLGDHAAGGTLAAPVFRSFIKEALAGTPATPFRVPPEVRLVRVDPRTGRPTSVGRGAAIWEAYKPGTTPGSASQTTAAVSGKPARKEAAPASSQSRYSAGPMTGTGGLY